MSDIYEIFGNARFAFRSDTLENWENLNPTLLSGEFSVVSDGTETQKVKIGDGETEWKKLPWWKGPQGEKGEQGPQGIQGIQGPQGEKGDKGDTDDLSAVAPSISNTISGGEKSLTVNDVSPLAHKCSLRLTSDTHKSANIYEFNSDNMSVTTNNDSSVSYDFEENGTIVLNGEIVKEDYVTIMLHISTENLAINENYTVSARLSDNTLFTPAVILIYDKNGNEIGQEFETNIIAPTESVGSYKIGFYVGGTTETEDPDLSYFKNEIIYPQLELGSVVTEWQEYGGVSYIEDYTTVTVNVNGTEYTPNMDGTLTDIVSASPSMEITTDNEKANICDFTYCVDTKKYIDNNSGDSSALGDIETALDNIIAIQDNLIGGDSV